MNRSGPKPSLARSRDIAQSPIPASRGYSSTANSYAESQIQNRKSEIQYQMPDIPVCVLRGPLIST